MPNLIFCDCETTGLSEAKDYIVEIALVAVELPTFKVVARYTSVVLPPMWPSVKRNLNEKVAAMHTASGLMAELDALSSAAGGDAAPRNAALVQTEALAFFHQHAPRTLAWQSPLAGANPDFDRRFLRGRMPQLHQTFHYRNFDVRSITQLQDWVFGETHRESPHRALPDCEKAIQDIRSVLGP
jgi:oligoribonuclease